jgi:aspartate/methionine/tyrosine aminotransferase/ribosomal protein S18 acetylase RimI-like enzyme
MSIRIKECRSDSADFSEFVDQCAVLMAATSPWSQLYFGIDQCRELLASKGLELFKALRNDEFAGFIALRGEGVEGEPLIEYVCVSPEHRGKEVGRKLIADVEARCKDLPRKPGNIYLFVSDFNVRAIKLYELLGYRRVGALPDYNVYGQTEYLYRRTLHPRQQEKFESKYPGNVTLRQSRPMSYDLNSGYARMAMPNAMRDLVIERTHACYESLGRDQTHNLGDSLHSAFLSFIASADQTARHVSRTFSTFSGSIALERIFGAIRRLRPGGSFEQPLQTSTERSPLTVILPEPSLDLWQHLLRERSIRFDDIQIVGVRGFNNSEQRTDRLIDELERQKPASSARQIVVIVDSPSNPQGFLMKQDELRRLARECKFHDATLVLDHCFLVAGLHYRVDQVRNIASAYTLPPNSGNWFAVWDTGKSIDLAGDKVAFVTASNDRLKAALERSLQVIQPSTFTAQRSLEVLRGLFEQRGVLQEYLVAGHDLCKTNLDYLISNLPKEWDVQTPHAGTFACVYTESLKTSEEFARFWAEAGVGVAQGQDFMVSMYDEGSPVFVRLSLFKPQAMFEAAVGHAIRKWAEFLQQRSQAVHGHRDA